MDQNLETAIYWLKGIADSVERGELKIVEAVFTADRESLDLQLIWEKDSNLAARIGIAKIAKPTGSKL
jgi:hypothetical protein